MGAAFLAGIGVTASGLYRYDGDDGERSTGFNWNRGRTGVYTLVAGLLIASTIAYVPAGHRGVVMDAGSGVNQTEKGEGVSLVLPFWQRVHNVNVRTQVYEYESFIQTKDLQEVTLPLAINYHVDPSRAAAVFQEVGHDYAITIIDNAAFQASTEAAGLIEAADIAQSRAQLVLSMQRILKQRLDHRGIIIEFVSVKDAVFDPQFLASVKAKVIATQKAEESLRLVDVSRNEADQLRAEASGIADALAIEAAAESAQQELLGMTANEYVWFRTWNGVLPTTLLDDGGEFIVDLP
jgi:regulator of protease activity HflC (stomatin/prohibitin superfamily)